jgi:hypothetical protein
MRLRPYWFQLLLIAVIVLGCSAHLRCQTFDKKFVAVTSATMASAAFDAWSTNRNLDHGYIEQNMILGPRPAHWNVWALSMGESAGWSTAAYFVKRATRNSPEQGSQKYLDDTPGIVGSGTYARRDT